MFKILKKLNFGILSIIMIIVAILQPIKLFASFDCSDSPICAKSCFGEIVVCDDIQDDIVVQNELIESRNYFYSQFEKPSLLEKFIEIIFNKKFENEIPQTAEKQQVYLSGYPIGFTLDGDGVIIVDVGEVETLNGFERPTLNSDIKSGDVLKKINNEEIVNSEKVGEIINREENKGKSVELLLDRKGQEIKVVVLPVLDKLTNNYKLGLWVRENAIGVGTVTYIKNDNLFGGLGHPITDIDTGTVIPIRSGNIYKCTIVGVEKGQKGMPGEIKGMFLRGDNSVGSVYSNNKYGVFGEFYASSVDAFKSDLVYIAGKSEIMPGKARILSTINGSYPKYYDAEIIKTNYINNAGNECMIIRVTDKELLEVAGGIVQGMSGSPIVQNGKLVGCVTHVFVNDPTKGFANYIDDMTA